MALSLAAVPERRVVQLAGSRTRGGCGRVFAGRKHAGHGKSRQYDKDLGPELSPRSGDPDGSHEPGSLGFLLTGRRPAGHGFRWDASPLGYENIPNAPHAA